MDHCPPGASQAAGRFLFGPHSVDYMGMPKRKHDVDLFSRERRKIRESGVLEALIQYVEGKRDMSSSQVAAALGLLRKAVPDLSSFTPLVAHADAREEGLDDASAIDFRTIDPRR